MPKKFLKNSKSAKAKPNPPKRIEKKTPKVKSKKVEKRVSQAEASHQTSSNLGPQASAASGVGLASVQPAQLVEEMQSSYLDYAMSVIVARALPDVRDGLKPVHRRLLYALWKLGLTSKAKFRKSATVVGEVLGKYHPHGDIAVYDSLVRMAQDFAMRYPLVHGQGNFGSMDGDGAAAMRYTETKLKSISEELLFDIEKNTVNFRPNYDGSHQEPEVLPAKLPNLLLNGSLGIAVGMATNIPPHNLSEVVDAICCLIDNPEAEVDDLMTYIKGPDFPTGGIIYNINEIKQAYATGKGSIVIRSKTEIVAAKSGGYNIIVSEIPYQVNKANVLEKIAELVKDKKIDGLRDLRDESNKDGVRVVIELKKETYPQKILNRLFTHTQLQETFHVNSLALIDGLQPKVLTLKNILEEYIKHRQNVVIRRTEFELNRARERAHLLEGLKKAIDNIDSVIKIIKKSQDRQAAKIALIKKFKFTERQTDAILEMRLHQLANLERQRIEEELKEKRKLARELEALLKSPQKILGLIKKEITELKEKYGDERRTRIVKGGIDKFSQEDLIPNEPAIVMFTRDGYIKRLSPDIFKTQGRGGKGVVGLTTKEEDAVEHFFSTTTHSDILFFTTRGRVFCLKAYDIPVASRTAKGQALVNFLQITSEEKVSAVLPLAELEDYKYLVMVTTHGLIKKVDINAFQKVRRSGLIAIKLKTEDHLEWVRASHGNNDIILVTAKGQAIRFQENGVRAMGRGAAGVHGIRLREADEVVGMQVVSKDKVKTSDLFVVTEKGFGKKTKLQEFKVQGRGGSGIKTAKVTAKTGKIVTAYIITDEMVKPNEIGQTKDLVIISNKGQVIRLPLKSVPSLGRATQGVRLMRFKEPDDQVASATLV